jgi:lipoate-protein ligase A
MCIGYFQDAQQELDLSYCTINKLPVIRRQTGGGAVYIDQNQLFVQWIFQKGFLPTRIGQWFKWFTSPMIETFKTFGINAYYYPVNDVHVSGKKIVGTGAGTIGNAEIITGNFMFDFDYQTMVKALRLPDDKFRSIVKKQLHKYITTISREIEHLPEIEAIKKAYIYQCEKNLGIKLVKGNFTDEELRMMKELDSKFSSPVWLAQIQNSNQTDKLIKIHSGVWIGQANLSLADCQINITICINDNYIEEATILIDNDNRYDFQINKFEKALFGIELDEAKLNKVITSYFNKINLDHLIVSVDKWIKLIMRIRSKQLRAAGNGLLEQQSN